MEASFPRAHGHVRCMFQLAQLQDTAVKIIPENLGLPRLEALTQRLENTYVDKARKAHPFACCTSWLHVAIRCEANKQAKVESLPLRRR